MSHAGTARAATLLAALTTPASALAGGAPGEGGTTVVAVVGAPGTPEYGARFRAAANLWKKAAVQAGAHFVTVGLDPAQGAPGAQRATQGEQGGQGGQGGQGKIDRQRLKQILAREAGNAGGPLWLVLLGHGTFDGRTARFNLRGPDVSAEDLATWLEPLRRPLVFINTAPASAPFLKVLAGPDRVIVTATKTGWQQNATRLGSVLAEAIADPAADLDKDGQTSLLEAFLVAAQRVAASFEQAGLLTTEHALLEDNGDGLGTPADFFRGLRPIKKAIEGAAPDGHRAHQVHLVPSAPERALSPQVRQRRDQLELDVLSLRDARQTLNEEAYFARLEALLTELARLYARVEKD
jgi:hypothetical protein